MERKVHVETNGQKSESGEATLMLNWLCDYAANYDWLEFTYLPLMIKQLSQQTS